MVDLRESLRPAGSVTPLPVSEIAARAARRRRRRLATITVAALVITAGSAALLINAVPRPNAAIVADAADPVPSATTDPEPTAAVDPTPPSSEPPDTETSTVAPDAEAGSETEAEAESDAEQDTRPGNETGAGQPDTGPSLDDLATTPGLRTETTTTSRWEDGYCVEIAVSNDAATTADAWQVVLDLEGTIATLWSATVDQSTAGRFVFIGVEDYNARLGAGASTTFGACLDTEPG